MRVAFRDGAPISVISMDQQNAAKRLYRSICIESSTYSVDRRSVQVLEKY